MTFKVHTIETVPAENKATLEAIQSEFGFVPNILGIMAESRTTLDSLMSIIGALDHAGLSAVERRVVTLAVSTENECAYCVSAQSVMAGMEEMPEQTLNELRSQQALSDGRFDALREFTLLVMRDRGWVPEARVQDFLRAGFERRHALEIVTIVAWMTLANYVSHLSDAPLDNQFQSLAWSAPARKSA